MDDATTTSPPPITTRYPPITSTSTAAATPTVALPAGDPADVARRNARDMSQRRHQALRKGRLGKTGAIADEEGKRSGSQAGERAVGAYGKPGGAVRASCTSGLQSFPQHLHLVEVNLLLYLFMGEPSHREPLLSQAAMAILLGCKSHRSGCS